MSKYNDQPQYKRFNGAHIIHSAKSSEEVDFVDVPLKKGKKGFYDDGLSIIEDASVIYETDAVEMSTPKASMFYDEYDDNEKTNADHADNNNSESLEISTLFEDDIKKKKRDANKVLPAETHPIDENQVAEEMMKKFSFIFSDGQLYTFTYPGYEVLNECKLIALMRETASPELKSKKPQFWTNVVKIIKYTASIHRELADCEHPDEEIMLANGCLNVYTMELRDARPEDYITTFNNVEFNKINSEHGSVTEQFFERASGGNKEIKNRMWYTLGAILSPYTPFKKFFYVFGPKNSGKSIFCNLCRFMVGKKNCSSMTLDALCKPFGPGQLKGKLLNISGDTPAFVLKNLGDIKILTSGIDSLDANVKFGRFASIDAKRIKLMFASNNPLCIDPREDLLSFKTRVLIVPFPYTIPDDEIDTDLFDKLTGEIDYIIKKAAKKYRKLIDNNYQFPPCQLADNLLNKWFPEHSESSDILGNLIDEGVIEYNSISYLTTSELYDIYKEYCEDKQIVCLPQSTFIQIIRCNPNIQSRRFTLADGTRPNCIFGIKYIGK